MPYFPVDDGFHSHRKAIKAGVAAIGLWTIAGSWSNHNGTDGFVPNYILSRFDPDWEMLAARLVEVRLWEPAEQDDEKGIVFHDWTGEEDGVRRNYTHVETVQKRKQWAERQARSRAKQTDGGNVTRDNTRDSRVSPSVTTRVSHGGSHGVPALALSQPFPKGQNQEPSGVDLSALASEKFPDTMSEEDKPAAMRNPLTVIRCPEHEQPKIGDCVHCRREHGNSRWYCDPGHWSERDRKRGDGRDFARVEAWARR